METWKAVLAASLAGFSAYMQHMIVPVLVLAAVMAADYATGVARARVKKEWEKELGYIGVVKKVSCLVLIAVGMGVDFVIHLGVMEIGLGIDLTGKFIFGLLVTVWLIINELISITENCAEMGLPVPGWLQRILHMAQDSAEVKLPNTDMDINIEEERKE